MDIPSTSLNITGASQNGKPESKIYTPQNSKPIQTPIAPSTPITPKRINFPSPSLKTQLSLLVSSSMLLRRYREMMLCCVALSLSVPIMKNECVV